MRGNKRTSMTYFIFLNKNPDIRVMNGSKFRDRNCVFVHHLRKCKDTYSDIDEIIMESCIVLNTNVD